MGNKVSEVTMENKVNYYAWSFSCSSQFVSAAVANDVEDYLKKHGKESLLVATRQMLLFPVLGIDLLILMLLLLPPKLDAK